MNKFLAEEIARGIIYTGIEGDYDTVEKSTAYDYCSLGVQQVEGERADELLALIGGDKFIGRDYRDIVACGELEELQRLLYSDIGVKTQNEILVRDCLMYVETLQQIPSLDDTRCMIYAGMFCPTSTWVVYKFLDSRQYDYNLRSLYEVYKLFEQYYYISAGVGEIYRLGYQNRARTTYEYVAGIDLTTTYGIAPYGEAGNGY